VVGGTSMMIVGDKATTDSVEVHWLSVL
jgi:hypothetical protein